MDKQQASELLDQLRSGEQSNVLVTKEDFMVIRELLVQQKDREAFVGSAEKGGKVRYQYVKQQEGQS